MSSHDDIEAPEAKIARMETLLEIRQERYDSKIKELEQKNSDLEQKNSDLELDKRLSAMKLRDRATRPAVSIDSSDLALQAEVLQLRQDSAAKDEEVSHLRALLRNCQSNLTAIKQGFIALNKSYHETTEDLSTVVQDIDNVLKAGIAFKELQSRPSSIIADTAAGPSQPSSSASKPEKVATTTGSASTTSSTPDHAQALKSPAEKRRLIPKARVPLEQSPLFARPPVTHADLAVKREVADQTRSKPDKRQISQKPNKAFKRGGSTRGKDTRGRGDTRGTNVMAGSDEPPKTPEVKSSVTTPATQAGEDTVADKDKKASSNPSHAPTARRRRKVKWTDSERASYQRFGYEIPSETDSDDERPTRKSEDKSLVTTPATKTGRDTLADKAKEASSNPNPNPTPAARRRKKVSDERRAAYLRFDLDITSETDSEDEQEAESKAVPRIVPATLSYRPRYVERGSPFLHDTLSPSKGHEPSDAPIQQPETSDSSLTKSSAARTSQELSSNVRKRLADEGQLGTSASSKRLRST